MVDATLLAMAFPHFAPSPAIRGTRVAARNIDRVGAVDGDQQPAEDKDDRDDPDRPITEYYRPHPTARLESPRTVEPCPDAPLEPGMLIHAE